MASGGPPHIGKKKRGADQGRPFAGGQPAMRQRKSVSENVTLALPVQRSCCVLTGGEITLINSFENGSRRHRSRRKRKEGKDCPWVPQGFGGESPWERKTDRFPSFRGSQHQRIFPGEGDSGRYRVLAEESLVGGPWYVFWGFPETSKWCTPI